MVRTQAVSQSSILLTSIFQLIEVMNILKSSNI